MVKTATDQTPLFTRSAILAAAVAMSLAVAANAARGQTLDPSGDPGAPTNLIQKSGSAQPAAPEPAPTVVPKPRPALRTDLKGTTVLSVDDKVSGEVEDVVEQNGTQMAVVGFGGFLGFGKTKVTIPVTKLAQVSTKVVVVPMTDEQVKNLPKYEG